VVLLPVLQAKGKVPAPVLLLVAITVKFLPLLVVVMFLLLLLAVMFLLLLMAVMFLLLLMAVTFLPLLPAVTVPSLPVVLLPCWWVTSELPWLSQLLTYLFIKRRTRLSSWLLIVNALPRHFLRLPPSFCTGSGGMSLLVAFSSSAYSGSGVPLK
jgi:hypothetical protein